MSTLRFMLSLIAFRFLVSIVMQDFTFCDSTSDLNEVLVSQETEEYIRSQNWFERNAILISNILVVISVGCTIVGVFLIEVIEKK